MKTFEEWAFENRLHPESNEWCAAESAWNHNLNKIDLLIDDLHGALRDKDYWYNAYYNKPGTDRRNE